MGLGLSNNRKENGKFLGQIVLYSQSPFILCKCLQTPNLVWRFRVPSPKPLIDCQNKSLYKQYILIFCCSSVVSHISSSLPFFGVLPYLFSSTDISNVRWGLKYVGFRSQKWFEQTYVPSTGENTPLNTSEIFCFHTSGNIRRGRWGTL